MSKYHRGETMHYPVSITKKMLEDKIKYLNNQYELNLNAKGWPEAIGTLF